LKSTKRLELSGSRGLRISQELKAIKLEAQHFPPGEEVAGRFVLGEMIGRGPFGEVYRATDNEIDADVAVKIYDE
jgi:serine/threonine protein kinase